MVIRVTLIAVGFGVAWFQTDLDLEHNFHEVETLPENDRVRYTVSPAARRDVLKRLFAENHARAKSETQNPVSRFTRGRRKRANTLTGPIYSCDPERLLILCAIKCKKTAR